MISRSFAKFFNKFQFSVWEENVFKKIKSNELIEILFLITFENCSVQRERIYWLDDRLVDRLDQDRTLSHSYCNNPNRLYVLETISQKPYL